MIVSNYCYIRLSFSTRHVDLLSTHFKHLKRGLDNKSEEFIQISKSNEGKKEEESNSNREEESRKEYTIIKKHPKCSALWSSFQQSHCH